MYKYDMLYPQDLNWDIYEMLKELRKGNAAVCYNQCIPAEEQRKLAKKYAGKFSNEDLLLVLFEREVERGEMEWYRYMLS